MSVLDVKVKPNLTVGYVMGVGDEIPPALEQLGAQVELLTRGPARLGRSGPARRGDDRRPRLRAPRRSARLQPAPARLRAGRRHGDRQLQQVRVQPGAVRPVPGQGRQPAGHRRELEGERARSRSIRSSPRPTGSPTPTGRAGARSAASTSSTRPTRSYTELVEFVEPFPYNQGPKRGAMVEAKVGSGRWIYLGVGLWRQLPAGTDGAYRLMANLISLGSAPGAGARRRARRSNSGARRPVQSGTSDAGRCAGAAISLS